MLITVFDQRKNDWWFKGSMVWRIDKVWQINRNVLGLKKKWKPPYLMCNLAFLINVIKYWLIINYTMIETSEHISGGVLIVIPCAIITQSNIFCRDNVFDLIVNYYVIWYLIARVNWYLFGLTTNWIHNRWRIDRCTIDYWIRINM